MGQWQYVSWIIPIEGVDVKFPKLWGAGDVERFRNIYYGIVKFNRPDIIVELGCRHGTTAIYMGQALKDLKHGHLYTIDAGIMNDHDRKIGLKQRLSLHPPENFERFGVAEYVTFLSGYFSDYAQSWDKGPINILHIDGFHTWEYIEADYTDWKKHLASDAILLIHDACCPQFPDVMNYIKEVIVAEDGWNADFHIGPYGLAVCTR